MAVPVRSKPERVYVNIVLFVDSTGFMKPSAIKWTDGRTFDIERIRDFRPASAAGNDINGDCYTVVIKGQDRYLFFEEANPHFSGRLGRWFVEVKAYAIPWDHSIPRNHRRRSLPRMDSGCYGAALWISGLPSPSAPFPTGQDQ